MTDVPIMFSGSMVLALLAGRKTMTRRINRSTQFQDRRASHWARVKIGDRLWVREAMHDKDGFCYAADNTKIDCRRAPDDFQTTRTVTMPSMFMPRWASRLTLLVTGTKTERVQEINNTDAECEGVRGAYDEGAGLDIQPADVFADLWKSLHGPGSWDANPEVVVITFTVHKQNIDALRRPL